MKKKLALLVALVLTVSTLFTIQAFAVEVPYMATVFGCGDEGLSVRSNPDPNSEKMGAFPDDNHVYIRKIADNGWGYISQSGVEGWICLQWTKVQDTCTELLQELLLLHGARVRKERLYRYRVSAGNGHSHPIMDMKDG